MSYPVFRTYTSEAESGDTKDFVDLSSASVPSLLVSSSGQPAGDQQRFFETSPRSYSDDGGPAPDFRGKTLRTVLELAASRGVDVVPEGRGIARSQIPAPGEPLEPGKPVKVSFRR